jgi:hypothetical protein
MIQQNLSIAQSKAQAHRNRHAHQIPFKEGDWVLLKNNHPKTKWDPKFSGPWRIDEQISPVVFDIEMDNGKVAVHAAHLKPYFGKVPPDEPDEFAPNTATPEEENESANYWIPPARDEAQNNDTPPNTGSTLAQASGSRHHQDNSSQLMDIDSEPESDSEDADESRGDSTQFSLSRTSNRFFSPAASSTPQSSRNSPNSLSFAPRSSPLKAVKRLFRRQVEREIELPPLNIKEREKRAIKPPDFYHNSPYSRR